MKITETLRHFLLQQKDRADSLLFLLSCLAIALFASNEIVAFQPSWLMGYSTAEWSAFQIVARTGIWIVFVAHMLLYGMLSGSPLKYAKEHLVELLICLAWFPHGTDSLLQGFTSILSIETVQLAGMIANGILVVRNIVRSLTTHPMIVTGSVFLLVIFIASELLMVVEPQTFSNLFDSIWYSVVTTTTIGYGDIVPKTFAGRCIGMGLMLSGISLAGAFIGIVSQSVQKRLGQTQSQKELDELQKRLADEQERNQRLTEALEKDNELKAKLLALLEKQGQ